MIGKAVKAAKRELTIFYTLQKPSLVLGFPWMLDTNLQEPEAIATFPWTGKTDQANNSLP